MMRISTSTLVVVENGGDELHTRVDEDDVTFVIQDARGDDNFARIFSMPLGEARAWAHQILCEIGKATEHES